jgi:endonuclease/exonuclease/phosphatase family metal-dependent hydrolase
MNNSKMKVLLVLLVATLAACGRDPHFRAAKYAYYRNYVYNVCEDSSLTVVTYNIQLGFPDHKDPWDKSQTGGTPDQVHALAEVLRKVNPGIIALQEVPFNRANTQIKRLLEALADSLDMNLAYGSHGKNDPYGVWPVRGMWGNAILSKFPILAIENREVYYDDKWKRRSVLRATIQLREDLIMDAYSLHHSGTDAHEVENTRGFIANSPYPVLVGGDFNRSYGHPGLEGLSGLQDVFKDKLPGIDRIYSSLRDTVYRTGSVWGSYYSVSDHPACYAVLKLKGP